MTKQDYSKGKVYKITCDVEGAKEIYVGSSAVPLKARLNRHQTDAVVLDKSGKLYDYIRKHGFAHFHIELLEHWPCANKTELRKQEQVWMDRLHPTLNMRRAYGKKTRTRTKKDWKYYWAWKKKQAAQK